MASVQINQSDFTRLCAIYTLSHRGATEGERNNASAALLRMLEKLTLTLERFHAYLELRHPDRVLHVVVTARETHTGRYSSPTSGNRYNRYSDSSPVDDIMDAIRREWEVHAARMREAAEKAEREKSVREEAEATAEALGRLADRQHHLHQYLHLHAARLRSLCGFSQEDIDIMRQALKDAVKTTKQQRQAMKDAAPPPRKTYEYRPWDDIDWYKNTTSRTSNPFQS